MTTGIKHAFVSGKADGVDPTLVRPSNWNDTHTITGDTTWLGFKLTNVGALGIGMVPANALDITQSQNANSSIKMLNASGGAAATSKLWLSNGAHEGSIVLFGQTSTTAGAFRQDGMLLYTDGAGGMTYSIPSDNHRWYIGGNLTAALGTSGLAMGSTTFVSGDTVAQGTTNTNLGALSLYAKCLIFVSWNGGSGHALCVVAATGAVTVISSSNSAGGDNCFDTTNGASSNGGNGVALFNSGGFIFIQQKTSYNGGTITVHRFGG